MKVVKRIIGFIVISTSIMLISFARVDVPYEVVAAKYTTDHSQFVDIKIDTSKDTQVPLTIHLQRFHEDKEDVIVLIHGVFSSSHTFIDAATMLKDFQVILIDLPGHGLSSLYPDDVTGLSRHAEVVYQTLQVLNINTFFIGGNSLGGGVSWYFMHVYHDDVTIKGLILIDALSPELASMMAIPALQFIPSFFINVLSSMTPKSLFSMTLNQVYGDVSPTDEMIQRHYDLVRREGVRRQVPAFVWEPLDDIDYYQMLEDSKLPVLIAWGEDDTVIPVDVAYQFADRILNHTLVVYDNVGHEPHGEVTQRFVQDLITFIRAS